MLTQLRPSALMPTSTGSTCTTRPTAADDRVILLHGGLGSGRHVRTRANGAGGQSRGHHARPAGAPNGRHRPTSIRLMADDIAALIRHRGLDRPRSVGTRWVAEWQIDDVNPVTRSSSARSSVARAQIGYVAPSEASDVRAAGEVGATVGGRTSRQHRRWTKLRAVEPHPEDFRGYARQDRTHPVMTKSGSQRPNRGRRGVALAAACRELAVPHADIAFVDTVVPPPRFGLALRVQGRVHNR